MKKFMNVLLVAVVVLGSSASFARSRAKSPDSLFCYVPQTGQLVLASNFFSLVADVSRDEGRCIVGKIYNESYSTRIYYNGRRIAKGAGGLSNSEAADLKRLYGLTGSCTTYTCDEVL